MAQANQTILHLLLPGQLGKYIKAQRELLNSSALNEASYKTICEELTMAMKRLFRVSTWAQPRPATPAPSIHSQWIKD